MLHSLPRLQKQAAGFSQQGLFAPVVWKWICALLVFLLLVQNVSMLYSTPATSRGPPLPPSKRPIEPPASAPYPWDRSSRWTYDAKRDANNHALSREQCDAAFPELYYEIDRAVKSWQDRNHTIAEPDIRINWRRDGAFRVLVHDNQVRITQTRNTNTFYRLRTHAMLHQLYRAVLGATAVGENLPTAEFAVTVDDMSLIPGESDDTHAIWGFTRTHHDDERDRMWVMPDFNFWADKSPYSSSFADMQRRAKVNDALLVDKIPKVVWRGVKWTNEAVRGSLLAKTADKSWADVSESNWESKTNLMAADDLCRYAFVVHTEGRSWSGRLKYLLNCNSLPIVHKLDWTTHFYHLLIDKGPEQNYIPVKRDFSDLESKVKYYLKHKDEAQAIADNAEAMFRSRYTTPAAESCYWRRMLHGWSEVAFTPELYETVTDVVAGKQVEKRSMRGVTYEEFVNMEGEYPPVPSKGG